MSWLAPLKEAVAGILAPAIKVIDDLHTSDEEKLTAKAALYQAQVAFELALAQETTKRLESQHRLQIAEATSESALTRIWRPISGLGFVGIVLLVYGKAVIAGTLPVELPWEFWASMTGILGVAIWRRTDEKKARMQPPKP